MYQLLEWLARFGADLLAPLFQGAALRVASALWSWYLLLSGVCAGVILIQALDL